MKILISSIIFNIKWLEMKGFNNNCISNADIHCVTKMQMDTCIRTRKIIKCSVLIDSYLHHV
jgi:hypothetical protein